MTEKDTAFEELCRVANIPKDRMGLVRRNLELKSKLESIRRSFLEVAETTHMVLSHSGLFAECDKALCKAVIELVELHRP